MLRNWVKQKMPDRVIVEAGAEDYLTKDFDVPPTPENVIKAGMAATTEQAQALIARDKSLWGGTRERVPLAAMETMFGDQFPASVPIGGKPRVYAKLVAADDEKDASGAVIGEKGFRHVFTAWRDAGLIT